MGMTMQGIILNASRYSFRNDRGENVEGTTIMYIFTDSLRPIASAEREAKGYEVAKASLPVEVYPTLKEVPGIYDLDISMKMNRTTMKGEMVITSAAYRGSLVDSLPEAG